MTATSCVDDSWFDAEREPPGFDQEHGDRAYLAPTGALSLNWNAVGVFLRPGAGRRREGRGRRDGAAQRVLHRRQRAGHRHQRRSAASTSPRSPTRTSEHAEDRRRRLRARSRRASWSVYKKHRQPAAVLRLHAEGAADAARGEGEGPGARWRTAPPSAKLLTVYQSDTLDIVLKRMNKHSSNFVAEQLIKMLGAEGKGAAGHPRQRHRGGGRVSRARGRAFRAAPT